MESCCGVGCFFSVSKRFVGVAEVLGVNAIVSSVCRSIDPAVGSECEVGPGDNAAKDKFAASIELLPLPALPPFRSLKLFLSLTPDIDSSCNTCPMLLLVEMAPRTLVFERTLILFAPLLLFSLSESPFTSSSNTSRQFHYSYMACIPNSPAKTKFSVCARDAGATPHCSTSTVMPMSHT